PISAPDTGPTRNVKPDLSTRTLASPWHCGGAYSRAPRCYRLTPELLAAARLLLAEHVLKHVGRVAVGAQVLQLEAEHEGLAVDDGRVVVEVVRIRRSEHEALVGVAHLHRVGGELVGVEVVVHAGRDAPAVGDLEPDLGEEILLRGVDAVR